MLYTLNHVPVPRKEGRTSQTGRAPAADAARTTPVLSGTHKTLPHTWMREKVGVPENIVKLGKGPVNSTLGKLEQKVRQRHA